jgi:hypothetical protein
VGCVRDLALHLKKHTKALQRRVRVGRKHKVEAWLQQHSVAHMMRFEEVSRNRGRRTWNVNCDACGTQLSVGCVRDLELHLKKHTKALQRRFRVGEKHKVEAWLQDHNAAHMLRFEEVVRNRGRRAWNVNCDACGTQLSVVCMSDLERHMTSTNHADALCRVLCGDAAAVEPVRRPR